MSWCLGRDFNDVRFSSERSTGVRVTSMRIEFPNFIDSCNLMDPSLEGACYTPSSHEEVLLLYQIDRFLFMSEWEGHF